METGIHNTSEIGRLRKVMLHRPGQELENLMPEYLERLLFDDIPYLKEAQADRWLRPEELDSVNWLPADRELLPLLSDDHPLGAEPVQ